MRALEQVGHGIGLALSAVLLGVVWLVVVVPVALLNRVVRIDLLALAGPSGWHRVEAVDRPRRQYRREPRSPGALGPRLVRLAVVLVPLAVIAFAVVDKANTVPPPANTPFGKPTGEEVVGEVYEDTWVTYRGVPVSRRLFPGEPWGAEVLTVQEGQPYCEGVDVESAENPGLDLATEHVNVVDGRRQTLTVDRPEHTVWMFGGSTTYGVGQRDDHTIASELVRLARADGMRLEVLNLGCPGRVNWVETEHFRLLLERVPPPDAAIFLDGTNEWAIAFNREEFGLFDTDVPFLGYGTKEVQDFLLAAARARGYVESHDPVRQMRLAAEQYRPGVERARRLGDQHGVPVVHFWQPAMFTMPPSAPGNPTVYANEGIDPASAVDQGQYYRRAAVLSGVEPIDLLDIFDDARRPLFFDMVHTNEAGARLEAAAIYPFVVDALGP